MPLQFAGVWRDESPGLFDGRYQGPQVFRETVEPGCRFGLRLSTAGYGEENCSCARVELCACGPLRCPLGGNGQMVATTASIDLIANKGAQCAHMSIFTNYQVKRCGCPMLLQNWGREQWNRRGAGTLIGDAGWVVRTARRGRCLRGS